MNQLKKKIKGSIHSSILLGNCSTLNNVVILMNQRMFNIRKDTYIMTLYNRMLDYCLQWFREIEIEKLFKCYSKWMIWINYSILQRKSTPKEFSQKRIILFLIKSALRKVIISTVITYSVYKIIQLMRITY